MTMKAIIPLLGFLGICVFFAIGLTRDPSKLPTELINAPFPEFNIATLDDPDASITEDIFQDRISLVNVFGSWCASCVVEHPKLMSLSDRDDILMIGIDWRDTRQAGAAWLARYGNPYDVVLFDGDSALAIALGITGAPETFLVGPEGHIAYKHVGVVDDAVWASEFEPRIAQLQLDAS